MIARLINLTAHPIHLYPEDTAKRIDPAAVAPIAVIPAAPRNRQVRFGLRSLGTDTVNIGYPVFRVLFGGTHAANTDLPAPCPGTWYIVSLAVAITHPDRADLLMPYGNIRDRAGTVIGVTGFARSAATDGDQR